MSLGMLPPEVLALIVEEAAVLNRHLPSLLYPLCRVSKAFLAPARAALYRRINFTLEETPVRKLFALGATTEDWATAQQVGRANHYEIYEWNQLNFVLRIRGAILLQTLRRHRHLARLVRAVKINAPPSYGSLSEHLAGLLSSVLLCCRNVDTIDTDGCASTMDGDATLEILAATDLKLKAMCIYVLNDLAYDYLTQQPDLLRLIVDGHQPAVANAPTPPDLLFSLDALRLSMQTNPTFTFTHLTTHSHSTLRFLDLDRGLGEDEVSDLSSFSSLSHLSLSIPYIRSNSLSSSVALAATCQTLKTFALRTIVFIAPSDCETQSLVALPPSLTHLNFNMYGTNELAFSRLLEAEGAVMLPNLREIGWLSTGLPPRGIDLIEGRRVADGEKEMVRVCEKRGIKRGGKTMWKGVELME